MSSSARCMIWDEWWLKVISSLIRGGCPRGSLGLVRRAMCITHLRSLSLMAVFGTPLVSDVAVAATQAGSQAPRAPLDSMLPHRSANPESVLIPRCKLPIEGVQTSPITQIFVFWEASTSGMNVQSKTQSTWRKTGIFRSTSPWRQKVRAVPLCRVRALRQQRFVKNSRTLVLKITQLCAKLSDISSQEWRIIVRWDSRQKQRLRVSIRTSSTNALRWRNGRLIRHWRIACNWLVIGLYEVTQSLFCSKPFKSQVSVYALHIPSQINMKHSQGEPVFLSFHTILVKSR